MLKKINGVYVGFGILIGIWLSTFISYFSSVDYLVALSIFGGGICFLGFIHFWGKTNGLKEKVKDVAESGSESKSLFSKPKIWKR